MTQQEANGHRHVRTEEVLEYLAGSLDEARASKVEESIGVCDSCAQQATRLRALAGAVDRWTAVEHGQAYWRGQLTSALDTAADAPQYGRWRDRLARWREAARGRAEAAVRVVMRAPGVASDLVTDGLDLLVRPESQWRFQRQARPVPVLGPAGEERAEPVTVVSLGRPRVRVVVGGEACELVVRVDEVGGAGPGLVMLIGKGVGAMPQVVQPGKQPGQRAYLARFKDLAPGEYLVVFEPR
jgi:hypothetical protein